MQNKEAFFALLQAGLWEKEVRLAPYGEVDFSEILRLATEQSVVGLVAAGLEHVTDVKVPQEWALQFIGQTLQIEQRNKAMNAFVAELISLLRKKDIYAILVKGQGIAQCYEKPLWRASGDVDLLLSDDNYKKAQMFLVPLASKVETEYKLFEHQEMIIDNWVLEIHGCLHSGLSTKIDKELDVVQYNTFCEGQVRSWMNGKTQVFLLNAENDAFYVFTHILQHFYKGGIGLRQICDWCRLLWTYRDSMDYGLLEKRIRRAGLMSEWKAFYVMATKYLGMPELDSSFMSRDSNCSKWEKKADLIMDFVLMSGNFGHNRDSSYYNKYPYLVRKSFSMGRRIGDVFRHTRIFPLDSLRFSFGIIRNGLMSAVRGE